MNRFLLGLLISLISFAASPAQAQEATLANGLRLIVRVRPQRPLAALDCWMPVGASAEKPEEAGAAHFLEHALFKGVIGRGAGELDFALEALGGVWGAATGADYTRYYTALPPEAIPQAIGLLATLLRSPTLPEKELEREKGVILDELAQHAADPQNLLTDWLYAAAMAGHPYSRSPGGSPESIRARNRASLLPFYRRNYAPKGSAIVVVGAVDFQKVLQAVESAFGDWKNDSAREAVLPETAAARSVAETRFAHEGGIGFAFPAPSAKEARQSLAAQIAIELLNGGRLLEAGLAGARARYTPRREASLLLITLRLPLQGDALLESQTSVEASLMMALRRLSSRLVSSSELAYAKQRILSAARSEAETLSGQARQIGYAVTIGAEPPETLQKRLAEITPKEIQDYCADSLRPERMTTVRLAPFGREAAPK